jgi:PAS domain S-box-containing protein
MSLCAVGPFRSKHEGGMNTNNGLEQLRVLLDRLTHEKKEADHRYHAIFNAGPDAILIVSRDGLVREANRVADRVFGYPDLYQLPVKELIPDGHAALMDTWWRDPKPHHIGNGVRPLHVRCRDGTELPVSIGLSPLEIDGELCAVATIRLMDE